MTTTTAGTAMAGRAWHRPPRLPVVRCARSCDARPLPGRCCGIPGGGHTSPLLRSATRRSAVASGANAGGVNINGSSTVVTAPCLRGATTTGSVVSCSSGSDSSAAGTGVDGSRPAGVMIRRMRAEDVDAVTEVWRQVRAAGTLAGLWCVQAKEQDAGQRRTKHAHYTAAQSARPASSGCPEPTSTNKRRACRPPSSAVPRVRASPAVPAAGGADQLRRVLRSQ